MEYSRTSRGKPKLILDGFVYTKSKDSADGESIFWQCENRGECKGRLSTFKASGLIKAQITGHSHAADISRTKVLKAVADMKDRATTSDDTTSAIINNCSANLTLTAAAVLPSKSTLGKMIRRKRKAPDGDDIPDRVLTTRGEEFLLEHDLDTNIVILATAANLRLLSQYPHWFCDGTFDSAPLDHQLYTIHILIDDSHTIPLVFCITRNKSEAVYRRIFEALKNHNPDLEPQTVMTDFESAAINALTREFPNATLTGCLFHFGQCLYRKLQELGFQQRYCNDEEFALTIRKFQALAFVPPEDVIEVYGELVASLDNDMSQDLERFLAYFETTWVGTQHRGRRRRPLFDVRLWNVYERVIERLPRTNNSVEGWHRAFDRRINVTHPSKIKLLNKLVKEQNGNEVTIEQMLAGRPLPPQKKKYIQLTSRLNTVVQKYNEVTNNDFLRAIAHNLAM